MYQLVNTEFVEPGTHYLVIQQAAVDQEAVPSDSKQHQKRSEQPA